MPSKNVTCHSHQILSITFIHEDAQMEEQFASNKSNCTLQGNPLTSVISVPLEFFSCGNRMRSDGDRQQEEKKVEEEMGDYEMR
ncbi:hypothetical protein BT93_E2897 [Corymbia citriodora subsp. variegata]|nr:hypothetical protein BT93_E2897 [Corymbia citriodora subsp. variegata]